MTSGDAPRILVASGPTHEPIDAVRYLANRSSGRMGVAIADAARAAGAEVTLALGPVAAVPPAWADAPRFRTAADLLSLLTRLWPGHDALIMAAAVADFTPESPSGTGKLDRSQGPLSLRLVPTRDVLAGLAAARRPDQFVVGFALEPREALEARAAAKLARKGVDAIVANPLETMDAPTVEAALLHADGRVERPPATGAIAKEAFVGWLMGRLLPLIRARREGLRA
ncbi:MAG: phosphopantothenoylcysteine decarboxylase [Phycisphaerales bacterium]